MNAGTAKAPRLSEDALADSFAERHALLWRYKAEPGCWLHWTGAVWQTAPVGLVRQAVRLHCRAIAARTRTARDKQRLTSEKVISSVERLARHDTRLSFVPADAAATVMLLNTRAGTVDLATGELRDPRPEAMFIMVAGAVPAPVGGCPRWCRFIAEISGGDPDLGAYLQRMCGYILTGSTREQVFFFLCGSGANGKSVVVGVLGAVLGEYATSAHHATFADRRFEPHPTELAGLVGARLVTVAETARSRAWDEARIKAVTGGEPIAARFMRQDFFTYVPTFKLVVVGNHRPRLGSTNEAMRRRLHLVPFDVTIPAGRRDPDLLERLLGERDAILSWMIQGCMAWQRIGLAPPKAVTDASAAYLASEDLVGQWIDAYCLTGPFQRAASGALQASWTQWCRANDHPQSGGRTLGESLRERGLQAWRSAHARGWIGIALRRGPADPETSEREPTDDASSGGECQ